MSELIKKRPIWATPISYTDGSGPGPLPVADDTETNDDFYARGPKDEITGDTDIMPAAEPATGGDDEFDAV